MKALVISPKLYILNSEFELSYVRSSGPGGQNVNKVNTKAVLRWNAVASASLPPEIRSWILHRLGERLTKEGDLIIVSDRFRDQIRNREDCLQKLRVAVLEASLVPKARRKTKPTYSSQRRSKETKSRNSQKKSLRKNPTRFE